MTTTPNCVNEAQLHFDQKYITASEVMRIIDITRATLLYARRSGKLPTPIVVNEGRLLIWERDKILPYLNEWKQAIDFKRKS